MFSFVATDKGEKQFCISLPQNMRSRIAKILNNTFKILLISPSTKGTRGE